MKKLSRRKEKKASGLRLIRSKGSITGVCAGLAEYFGIEVRNVRIGFAALTAFLFFTGAGIFKLTGFALYGLLMGILPRNQESQASPGPFAELAAEAPEEPEEEKEEEEAEARILCPNCNTVSKPHSVFCHACGTRL